MASIFSIFELSNTATIGSIVCSCRMCVKYALADCFPWFQGCQTRIPYGRNQLIEPINPELRELNTLRHHFAGDIFKCIFFTSGNVWIPIKISLKFVSKGPINNMPALLQIMDGRCSGDKPLPEPTIVSLSMLFCVTWSYWVNMKYELIRNMKLSRVT